MVLELFGEDFKNELLEELVSRGTTWASIKHVQEKTGWGRKKIEDFRDAGKFRYQQNAKGGKYLYDLNDVLRFQSQLAKG